ncbi:hypothetical protein SDC9_112839 [bioreactor metagenome]|uniref:Uncharacterized protein n=1 Tax=bioreactor metagenome TaxID=1076179 RepID=A0A645BKQ3_9ZZZZ
MVSPCFEHAPFELAQIAQIDALLLIVEHVHALVGVELVGHILITELGFDQMVATAQGEPEGMRAALVGGRSDFVESQAVADAAGRRVLPEIAAGLVVVGLGQRPGVADAEVFGGQRGRHVAADGVVVAAGEGADLALGQRALPRCRKLRRRSFGDDGTTNAVAAHADRRDACEDLDLGDIARVQIRQRRVHVVGAGGDEIHAVDGDAQAIVGQAVDGRQAGDAAGAVEADARHIAQQRGGVAGDGVLGGDFRRADLLRRGRIANLAGIDDDLVQRRLGTSVLPGHGGTGERNGGRQWTELIAHVVLPDFIGIQAASDSPPLPGSGECDKTPRDKRSHGVLFSP